MSGHRRSPLGFAAIAWITILCAVSVPAQPAKLTILHTNDMHAAFVPHEAMWIKETPRPLVGGFAELFFQSDSIRKITPALLMLDAGDVMTGNPITERVYGGVAGGALFEMMNRIGYDLWCPGNHDFDISQDNLRGIVRLAKFPTVCANLVNDRGEFLFGNRPYALVERGGIRIGIIGVMSRDLYNLVYQNNLVGIRVLSPSATVQKYVDELSPQTDLLIALTHEGVADDSMLATEVKGLDIIVGGHSHTRLKKPKIVNGVIIVQAGSNAENLGTLTVTADHHNVVLVDGGLIPLRASTIRPPSSVSRLADSMETEIEREYSEVIATLEGDWMRKDGQSAVGTFVADAQREAAGAEVGFMNNFGIRRDVAAGPLTKKTLFEMLPFRNILTTFKLSGRQLRDIMVYNIEKRPAIQIAGMSGVWERGAYGKVVFTSIEVGDRPLDEERMYVCAASDYFVGEAKRYLGLEVAQPVYLKQTVYAAVERAVRELKTITPEVRYTIDNAHGGTGDTGGGGR